MQWTVNFNAVFSAAHSFNVFQLKIINNKNKNFNYLSKKGKIEFLNFRNVAWKVSKATVFSGGKFVGFQLTVPSVQIGST
jgi:hypothetical protein